MTKLLVSVFLVNVVLFSLLVFHLQQESSIAFQYGYLMGRNAVYSDQAKSSDDGNCFTKGGCK